MTRGVAEGEEAATLNEQAGQLLIETIEARPEEERLDIELTRERVRQELRRFLRKRTQQRPLVIPVVMEV